MKKPFLAIFILLIILLGLYAFKTEPEAKNYQYLIANVDDDELEDVYVSIDGKEFKHLDFEKQSKGESDLNPIINLIHQYENEGWELVEILDENGSFYMKKEIN